MNFKIAWRPFSAFRGVFSSAVFSSSIEDRERNRSTGNCFFRQWTTAEISHLSWNDLKCTTTLLIYAIVALIVLGVCFMAESFQKRIVFSICWGWVGELLMVMAMVMYLYSYVMYLYELRWRTLFSSYYPERKSAGNSGLWFLLLKWDFSITKGLVILQHVELFFKKAAETIWWRIN